MRDPTGLGHSTPTAPTATYTEMALEFSDTELTVGEVMTETIISVGPHGTVGLAIQEMARYNISCILVATGGTPVGILTERDVLRGVARRYNDFVYASLAEEMSQPVISVDPDTTVLAASQLMGSEGIKRLLVVREQQPVGVVTQTDITSALIAMSPFRDVADVMTRDVVTVDETTTMTEAAQLMAASSISCVVALRADRAAGILTERDVVQHVARSRDDPTITPVSEIMSFPVVSVPPTHSVMSASRMMDQLRIHRLLVGSTTEIQGIVTQTDIIAATQQKVAEARRARAQRESDMGRLGQEAVSNLASLQDLCQGLLSRPACDIPAPEQLEARFAAAWDTLARLNRMVSSSDNGETDSCGGRDRVSVC
jgi:CBS domain-containing protein